MKQANFPKDFLWGASTSGHQVEGDTNNQWRAWEEAQAERLAKDAQTRLKHLYDLGQPLDWETIEPHATSPDNYRSGQGVAHRQKYSDDFALIKSLHMNAFRFSIEWGRIEPEQGQWDEVAITHYREYIKNMKSFGIEPVLTIWHWTMPTWFTDKGGFEKKQNIQYFDSFVAKVGEEFGKDVRYITILNEPNVYSLVSYIAGFWPPEKKNPIQGLWVYRNLSIAHRRAYAILKNASSKLEVGIAITLSQSYVHNPRNPINRLTVSLRDYMWNWWFLNRIRNHLDFIGLNFYVSEHLNWRLQKKNPPGPHNDLGWYMEPGALCDILVQASDRYRLPILITENGLADAQDTHRKWWIQESIAAMQKALTKGVPLIGYLHWSLLDNFEWSYGWWPKFGLVEVDRTTQKRTVRKSTKWFAEEIRKLRKIS